MIAKHGEKGPADLLRLRIAGVRSNPVSFEVKIPFETKILWIRSAVTITCLGLLHGFS